MSRRIKKWTEEEKEYLKSIVFGRSHDEILKLMNEKFEYEFTKEQIKGVIARNKLITGRTGHFEKGIIPWNKGTKGVCKANKTTFKKGNKSWNYKPVGSERINSEGYTDVKIADPNKWKLKHHILWEKEVGPIPEGYVLVFADRNKQNIKIENLLLVNKKQILTMNANNLISEEAEVTKAGLNLAKLINKISESNK